jgi:hypothetical protein
MGIVTGVMDGPQRRWGMYVSDVIFSYIACDTSLNLESDEESNRDGLQRKLWMVHPNKKEEL